LLLSVVVVANFLIERFPFARGISSLPSPVADIARQSGLPAASAAGAVVAAAAAARLKLWMSCRRFIFPCSKSWSNFAMTLSIAFLLFLGPHRGSIMLSGWGS
jgi:hypothetical protein